MVRISLVEPGGAVRVLAAAPGGSLMEAAVAAGVRGIAADCGGACACATCHVYIDPAWAAAVGPPAEAEAAMLDFVTDPRPQSRLACQIRLSAALDGLIARAAPA